MALSDFFQGKVPPSVTSTVEGSQSYPAWLQELVRSTALNAVGTAQEPYRPSPVPQVAGFTPDQQQAFQRIRDFQGAYRPYFDQSATLVSGATSPFNRQELAQYESPYIQGVANRSTELATRNLLQNVLPNINSTFTGSGQFGSSRHADFTNRAIRDATSELQGNLAGIHQQGLNEAYSQYNQGRNRLLSGATQFAGLGQQLQSQGYQDIGALSGAGEAQQALNQQNLSTAYKDFIEQREYPKEQLNFLQSIIRGLPYNSTRTSTTTAPYQGGFGASPLSQILGGISTGVGLGKLFGFAEGGQVTAKKLNQTKKGNGYQEGGLAEEDQEAFADPNIPTDDAYGDEGQRNEPYAPANQGYTDVNDDVLQQLNQYQQQSQRTALAQLQQARQQALSALQPQRTNDAGLYFALAQGFNAPTTTGSFGESFGNVGKALAPYAEQRAADEQAYRRAQAQYGLQSAEDAYKAALSPLKFHNVGDKTYADVGGRLVPLGSRRPSDIRSVILEKARNPETGEVDPIVYGQLARDAGLVRPTGSGQATAERNFNFRLQKAKELGLDDKSAQQYALTGNLPTDKRISTNLYHPETGKQVYATTYEEADAYKTQGYIEGNPPKADRKEPLPVAISKDLSSLETAITSIDSALKDASFLKGSPKNFVAGRYRSVVPTGLQGEEETKRQAIIGAISNEAIHKLFGAVLPAAELVRATRSFPEPDDTEAQLRAKLPELRKYLSISKKELLRGYDPKRYDFAIYDYDDETGEAVPIGQPNKGQSKTTGKGGVDLSDAQIIAGPNGETGYYKDGKIYNKNGEEIQ